MVAEAAHRGVRAVPDALLFALNSTGIMLLSAGVTSCIMIANYQYGDMHNIFLTQPCLGFQRAVP